MTFLLMYVYIQNKLQVEYMDVKNNYFCTKNHRVENVPEANKKIIILHNPKILWNREDQDLRVLGNFCSNVPCSIWYEGSTYRIIFEDNRQNENVLKKFQSAINVKISIEIVKSLGAMVHFNNSKILIGATSHRFLHLINMHPCNNKCFCVTGSVDNDGQEIDRFNRWYETAHTTYQ